MPIQDIDDEIKNELEPAFAELVAATADLKAKVAAGQNVAVEVAALHDLATRMHTTAAPAAVPPAPAPAPPASSSAVPPPAPAP